MRTLHINPRNYQEPFILIIIDHNSVTNGMDDFKVLKKIALFGSIMNRTINYSQNNIDNYDNTLSIKIVSQGLLIKPKDRIHYNGDQYIITSIDRDYYSKNEIVILCHYERSIISDEKVLSTKLNFLLNSKVGS